MSKFQKVIRKPFQIQSQLLPQKIESAQASPTIFHATRDCVNDSTCDASPPEALVFFIPGFAEKCENYGYFFERFSERLGMTVISKNHLHEGSGSNNNQHALLANENETIKGYFEFINEVDQMYKERMGGGTDLPKFIIGDGLGALYALQACRKEPDFFKGCISVNPLFRFATPYQVSGLAKMSLFWQKMGSKGEHKTFDGMSQFIPEQIAEHNLFGRSDVMSIQTYLQILNLQIDVQESVRKLRTPQLYLLAEKDEHVDNQLAHEHFNLMGKVMHKRLYQVPQAEHYMMSWESSYEEVQKESMLFIQRLLHDINIRK